MAILRTLFSSTGSIGRTEYVFGMVPVVGLYLITRSVNLMVYDFHFNDVGFWLLFAPLFLIGGRILFVLTRKRMRQIGVPELIAYSSYWLFYLILVSEWIVYKQCVVGAMVAACANATFAVVEGGAVKAEGQTA